MKKYLKYILCSIILIVSLCIFSSCANDHKEYSINFIIDEDIYKTIKTPGKELIELPSTKEKDKYEFDGWFFDKDKWNKKVLSTSFIDDYLTNDVDVYAHYNQLELVNDLDCSIIDYGRFNHNNDNLELIVDSGTSEINLEDEFEISNNCELIVCDEELNILDNIIDLSFGENTYKIKIVLNEYIEKEYSLLINRTTKYKCEILDNFGNVIDTKLYDSGNKIDIPSYQIDKKGYSFIGWGLKENDEIIDETYLINSSISLEPKYELLNYDIKYILDGGINNQANPSNYNVLSSINIQGPTKNGFAFKGWKVEGLSSTKYVKEFSIDKGTTGDITLTAVWEVNGEYEISYDMQGGVNNVLNPSMYSTADDYITIDKEPVKDGYRFLGWISNFNISPKKHISFESNYKQDVKLTANWVKLYNITYDLQGGTNDSHNVDDYASIDDDITIINPSRLGYSFDGWIVNGNGNLIKNYVITTGTTGSISLRAVWTKLDYTINYVLNGGTNNSNNVSTYTVTDNISLYAPTKQYSTFVGWSLLNGEPKKNYIIPTGSTGNITLYANWKNYKLSVDSDVVITSNYDIFVETTNECILSFDSNGGTSVSSQIITSTNKIAYPSIPTKAGYSFTGWYTDSNCTQLFDFSSNISSDTIVYAGWKEMVSSGYSSRKYWDMVSHNTSSNAVTVSMTNTNSSTCNYDYFTVLKTGTYNIYYKTSSSSTYDRIYLYIYNQTTGTVIKSNGYISNTSYTSIMFNASAGDVIYLKSYRYNSSYSPTLSFYIPGLSYPNVGGSFGVGYTLSFNSNGGTSVSSQVITNSNKITYPTTIPTKSGYSFTGWYKNSACTQLFDFTANIAGNTTVYAGWKAMASSGYYSRNYRNSISINSSSNAVSISTSGTTSSYCNYEYFTIFKSGTYSIYYRNNTSTSSYYRIYLSIYNQTTGETIKTNSYITSTSYTSISFTASAGDVIYLKSYRYNSSYSPSLAYYVTGMSYPSAGGAIEGFKKASHDITAGTTLSFTTTKTTNFIGWYANDVLVGTSFTINYVMPEYDVVLKPKYSS